MVEAEGLWTVAEEGAVHELRPIRQVTGDAWQIEDKAHAAAPLVHAGRGRDDPRRRDVEVETGADG